jgi:hypothetical protein
MAEPHLNALETLRAAAAHHVQISLDGDDLIMEAPTTPPDAVVAAIKRNKAAIVTMLRAATRPKGYTDDRWLAAVADAARLGYPLVIPEQERPC